MGLFQDGHHVGFQILMHIIYVLCVYVGFQMVMHISHVLC